MTPETELRVDRVIAALRELTNDKNKMEGEQNGKQFARN